jgi:hypothetical protein
VPDAQFSMTNYTTGHWGIGLPAEALAKAGHYLLSEICFH